jgi:hypothetical protein
VSEGLHIKVIIVPGLLRHMHTTHHARTVPRLWSGAGNSEFLALRQEPLAYGRHERYRGVVVGSQGSTVSLNKIHTDMVKPREAALRGTAADLSREGLDAMKGTRTLRQTHTKAPAVAAMARTSLRLGAFDVFPRQSGCGCTSAPEGGEMS